MTDKGPGAVPTYTAAQTTPLRIGILHSRWNTPIITSLVTGARQALTKAGVPPSNIITQSVPGAYELPLAAQRMLAASQSTASSTLVSAASDLLGSAAGAVGEVGDAARFGVGDAAGASADAGAAANGDGVAGSGDGGADEKGPGGPLDAIIAIGVLIKGSTMHFEYISDAVTHGLMRVQLDTGLPVVFGVLTCLTEGQARVRAGLPESATDEEKEGAGGDETETEATGRRIAERAMGKGGHYAEQGHNHGVDWGQAAVEMAVKRKAWGEGRFVD